MEENDGKYSKDNLKTLAKGITGLSASKFADCLDSNKYASTVQQMASAASSAGVSGTPAFIINGQSSSGSWAEISAKLQSLGVDTN
jgi:protein-disulfide isomerase